MPQQEKKKEFSSFWPLIVVCKDKQPYPLDAVLRTTGCRSDLVKPEKKLQNSSNKHRSQNMESMEPLDEILS